MMPSAVPVVRLASMLVAAAMLFAGLSVATTRANAQQAWPTKPIRLVVPYAAGGLADRLGRIVADKLSTTLGQRVLPDNRAGSAGIIAGAMVAKAAPDGYTLMVGGTGPHVTGPATNKNVGYDPAKDFTHIAMIGGDVFLLAANPSRGWKTLADLDKAARATGANLGYGSTGMATPTHFVMESYLAASGLKIIHVPYKGGGPAIKDVLGDHVAMVLVTLSSLAPYVRSGRLVPIALTSKERHPAFPEIKTFAEQGHPEVDGGTLFWLSAPAGLPAEITTRLNTEVRAVLRQPDVKDAFEKQLLVTSDDDVGQFQAFVADHMSRWGKVISTIGITVK